MKKLLLFFSLILVSCAHQNQKIDIDFSLKNIDSKIINQKGIEVIVFDYRPDDEVIGTKEFSRNDKTKIINNQNIASLINSKISQNLFSRGFKKGGDKTLEINIEELQYKARREFPVGSSSAEVKIRAVVKNSKSKPIFTKNFNLSLNSKHLFAPLESTDKTTINNLLQEITQDIVNSEELIKNLSQ